MTREDARFEAMRIDRDAGNHGGKYVDVEELVTRIYDDFETDSFDDVTFVWNESGNFIESIVLNTDGLALDVSKNYKVCIVEVKDKE